MTKLKISKDENIQVDIKNGSMKKLYLKLHLKGTGGRGLVYFFLTPPLSITCVLDASLRWKHGFELFIQILKSVIILNSSHFLN